MAAIKILYLTPSVRLSGARRSLLDLITNLSSGFEPVVVCPRKGFLSEELTRLGIRIVYIPLPAWRKGRYFIDRYVSVSRLRKLVKKEQPALLHSNEFYCNPYMVRAAAPRGVPTITHLRLYINDRMINNYHLSRTSRIVVVSNATSKYFSEWKTLQDKISVVYNGIDFTALKEKESREEIRQSLGYCENDFVIGQIALYSPRKRQHTTLEAARRVVKTNPDCKFLLVGESAERLKMYEQALRNKCDNYGLSDHIQFHPLTSHIGRIFKAIDLNLLISSNEGFGRVIPEAAELGTPTLGTKAGAIEELIRDGETGYLVHLDDIGAMTEKILELSRDREKLKAMGQKANALARNNFSIERHVRNMETLYREILNSRLSAE